MGASVVRTWSTPEDVRRAVLRLWESGKLLAGRVPGHAELGTAFPLRVPLRRPRSAQLPDRWDDIRDWAARLQAADGFRVETIAVVHRSLGTQHLPAAAWIDTEDQALALIGRVKAARHFDTLVARTQPEYLAWVAQHPLRLLDIGDDWPAVQAAATWLQSHPMPRIYVRQVEIPGVHTKVIEQHKRTIAELAPGQPTSGSGWFERRYGFLTNPGMVRFRTLDPALALLDDVAEMALPVADFIRLCPPASRIFVTENLTNYLCLPPAQDAIVVFGSGNEAPELLAETPAVGRAEVHYTGDIDTHGYAILDRFRARLPHTQSLLMDMQTLLTHRELWVTEKTQISRDLPHLTASEREVFDVLRTNQLGQHVRLEQERIAFEQVREAMRGR